MRSEILDRPDFGMLRVDFDAAGESVVAESGAMVARSAELTMKTSMRGGLMAAAKRKLLGGESIFQNTFTATAPGQHVFLAAAAEGDVEALELAPGEDLLLQSGAYLASTSEVTLDTKFGGLKGLFGAGMFLVKVSGPGIVWFNSYGAIHRVEIDGRYVCDNNNIVGFSPSLNYNVVRFGGTKGLFFSGEGLICEFQGRGTLYAQTRQGPSLAAFLHPYRPVKSSNND